MVDNERDMIAYQLRDTDYKKYVETISGSGSYSADYLTWSVCWDKLKDLYPTARHEWMMYTYGDKPFAGIMQPDGSVIVHCKISFTTQDGDDYSHDEYLAVRDNRNSAVANPDSAEMENTYRRCLAKGVSTLTGFGIGLWMNEDIEHIKEYRPQTLMNGQKPVPGGVTVDQNVKLDALMRHQNATLTDKEKLKKMKNAGWDGVTEQMAEILIADVKAGIDNNRPITETKKKKVTTAIINNAKMTDDEKDKAVAWLSIEGRNNLEVDTFVQKQNL